MERRQPLPNPHWHRPMISPPTIGRSLAATMSLRLWLQHQYIWHRLPISQPTSGMNLARTSSETPHSPSRPTSQSGRPLLPSRPGQTDHLDTTMAQLRSEMAALRLRDRQEFQDRHDELQRRMDLGESVDASLARDMQLVEERLTEEMQRMQEQMAEEMRQQRTVIQACATEFNGVVRYLHQERTGDPTTSTLPAFNPPHILLPATSMFPEIGSSISTFGRMVTNNVFMPDNSLLLGVGDVSPIDRRFSADRPTPLLPSRPPTAATAMPSPGTLRNMVTGPGKAAGPSAPPAPPAATIMPSPGTLHNMVTGPGDLPADGQPISVPARTRPGLRTHGNGRSVSGAPLRRASGGHGRK